MAKRSSNNELVVWTGEELEAQHDESRKEGTVVEAGTFPKASEGILATRKIIRASRKWRKEEAAAAAKPGNGKNAGGNVLANFSFGKSPATSVVVPASDPSKPASISPSAQNSSSNPHNLYVPRGAKVLHIYLDSCTDDGSTLLGEGEDEYLTTAVFDNMNVYYYYNKGKVEYFPDDYAFLLAQFAIVEIQEHKKDSKKTRIKVHNATLTDKLWNLEITPDVEIYRNKFDAISGKYELAIKLIRDEKGGGSKRFILQCNKEEDNIDVLHNKLDVIMDKMKIEQMTNGREY